MTVPVQNSGNPGAGGDGGNGGNPGGGDPNPNPNPAPNPGDGGGNGGDGGGSNGNVDLKSLSADQLQQVLENPNLWNLPRVKELREQAAEAKTLKDAQAQADEKALEDQKKFEELATKRGEEVTSLKTQLQNTRIDQALTNKLVPGGVVDLEAALKLIDRSKVQIDDNGNVSGIDEVIESLKTEKAYLFNKSGGSNDPNLGTPSNNNGGEGGGAPSKFKRSQLKDPKFYADNREEILKAMRAGLIEDDITPHQ